MTTKAELQEELKQLESRYALLFEDFDEAMDRAHKLENRHILVKVVDDDRVVIDAVVIPPDGKISLPIRYSTIDQYDTIDLYTEPIEV
jgi:hypothetical protein